MPLATEVGLGPGDIVLDGDPAPLPPPKKRAQQLPTFLLWPYGWMYQDATWCGGRSQPRPHCVRWGPSSPKKGGTAPNFGPIAVVPNG